MTLPLQNGKTQKLMEKGTKTLNHVSLPQSTTHRGPLPLIVFEESIRVPTSPSMQNTPS